MIPGVKVIGFADEALITVQTLDIDHLERKIFGSLKQVKGWLDGKQLEMAVKKKEVVRGIHKPKGI